MTETSVPHAKHSPPSDSGRSFAGVALMSIWVLWFAAIGGLILMAIGLLASALGAPVPR